MHSTDGATGEDPGADDTGPRVTRVGADGDEGDDEDDDGDEEGDGGYTGCVGDLEFFLAVGEDDGEGTDEVLEGSLRVSSLRRTGG